MAVIINFTAETENDVISPMTIASALAESPGLGVDDLEEISNHLRAYVYNVRKERIKNEFRY